MEARTHACRRIAPVCVETQTKGGKPVSSGAPQRREQPFYSNPGGKTFAAALVAFERGEGGRRGPTSSASPVVSVSRRGAAAAAGCHVTAGNKYRCGGALGEGGRVEEGKETISRVSFASGGHAPEGKLFTEVPVTGGGKKKVV